LTNSLLAPKVKNIKLKKEEKEKKRKIKMSLIFYIFVINAVIIILCPLVAIKFFFDITTNDRSLSYANSIMSQLIYCIGFPICLGILGIFYMVFKITLLDYVVVFTQDNFFLL